MISAGETFLGVPLVKARNVLKAWRFGGSKSAEAIGLKRDVGLPTETVAVLIEEMKQRGFIGQEDWEFGHTFEGLTEAGRAFVSAKARRRVAKEKAQEVLDAYLSKCSAANAIEDLPFRVSQVWLFGSMIDPAKSEVGDIDYVAVCERPGRYAEDHEARHRRYEELARILDIEIEGGVARMFAHEGRVRAHYVHGSRRHPLLAPNDMYQLASLGCPCRLVYDYDRGGLVDEPTLERHPSSAGRDPSVGLPAVMPDLRTPGGAIEPVDASNILTLDNWNRTFRRQGPWDDRFRERIYELFRLHQDGRPPVVAVGGVLSRELVPNVITRRLDFSECDGRRKFGLCIDEDISAPENVFSEPKRRATTGVTIERSISTDGDGHVYFIGIAGEASKPGAPIFILDIAIDLCVELAMKADIERIARRSLEAGRAIRLDIVPSAFGQSTLKYDTDRTERIAAMCFDMFERAGAPRPDLSVRETPSPEEEPTGPACR